jgi:hypothetical protein
VILLTIPTLLIEKENQILLSYSILPREFMGNMTHAHKIKGKNTNQHLPKAGK